MIGILQNTKNHKATKYVIEEKFARKPLDDAEERGKWDLSDMSCGIGGCEYNTGSTKDTKNHKQSKC